MNYLTKPLLNIMQNKIGVTVGLRITMRKSWQASRKNHSMK